MSALNFIVHGTPAPQGSKNMMRHRSTGKMIMVESAAKTLKPWRKAVRDAAMAEVAKAGNGFYPLTRPVQVRAVFFLQRPKSHYRTGKCAGQLKDSAPAHPDTRGFDVDKLVRAALDSLTGVAYQDDSLVVVLSARKMYADGDQALATPGAWIYVSPAQENSA